MSKEQINHPDHYGGKENPYEAIKVIRAHDLNFALGNAIKYILRAGKKDSNTKEQDLKKAVWYLQNEIENTQKTRLRLSFGGCKVRRFNDLAITMLSWHDKNYKIVYISTPQNNADANGFLPDDNSFELEFTYKNELDKLQAIGDIFALCCHPIVGIGGVQINAIIEKTNKNG